MVKVYMTACGLPALLETELIKKMSLHSPTPASPKMTPCNRTAEEAYFAPGILLPGLSWLQFSVSACKWLQQGK